MATSAQNTPFKTLGWADIPVRKVRFRPVYKGVWEKAGITVFLKDVKKWTL